MDAQMQYYWIEACKILEKEYTSVAMEVWIRKLIPISMDNEEFIFKADGDVSKETIDQRYLSDITNVMRAISEKNYAARIIISDELNSKKDGIYDKKKNELLTMNSNLKSKYVFETFVRGKSNELAYAAAVAISEAPGRTSYNPLFLYGGVGLGKTHLMHSIGNFILEKNPSSKVLYCSTETFMNELINSIRERKNQEFRNKYRDIDVLLIDDIQFLSEKEGTQEEFFHTFNTLYDANKQIVISSDQPPKEIKTLEDRLRSRFGCGLIVDITFPDFETRTAILEKKAELDHVDVPKEVTKFVAKNIVSNIRDLEGALNKVVAYATLSKTPITIELAEKALKDLISAKEKQEITVEFIQEIVANYYGITSDEIRSKKRTANITYPRQIAMYLSRKLIDMSLPKIGFRFGGRDHSTIIHGCDKIAFDIEKDKQMTSTIFDLEKKIKGE